MRLGLVIRYNNMIKIGEKGPGRYGDRDNTEDNLKRLRIKCEFNKTLHTVLI